MKQSGSVGQCMFMLVGIIAAAMMLCSAGPVQAASFLNSCTYCHGMPPKDGERKANPHYDSLSSATLGSHQKHLGAAPVAGDCSACHTPVDPADFGHQNQGINMIAPVTYGKGVFFNQTSIPLLNSTATCSTASCHADPYSAGTVTTPIWGTAAANCSACHTSPIGATGPATGGHAAHSFVCTSCHNSGTSATAAPTNEHRDGNIDVVGVGYPGNKVKGSVAATCSSASCHADPYSTGTVTTPVWGVAAGCTACHTAGFTGSGPATGSHAKHAVACTSCHNAGTTIAVAPTMEHLDGNIDVVGVGYPANKVKGSAATTCSAASCHADPYGTSVVVTPVWGVASGCVACHTAGFTATGPATGSHAKHAVVCTSCHNAGTTTTVAPTNEHADGNIDVVGVGYPANKVKGSAATTCSAASCHADPYGTSVVVTPVWGVASGCVACHTAGFTATGPATGSHAKHAVVCTSCHNAGTTTTVAPTNEHADGNIDVVGVGYPANKVKGSAATTCSAATCHADPYSAGTLTTPVWGTASGCAACHTAGFTATGPATGSHAKHAVVCTSCHNAGTTTTVAPTNEHTDGNIDVVGVGYPANKVKGSAATTCSAAACHADPYSAGTLTTPVWGTASGCAACHTAGFTATGPATGSHAKHAVVCTSCHNAGTTTTVAPTNEHADGNIDVVGVGYPANKVKGSAATTCSAAACHADPYSTGTLTTPVWGTASGCVACHTAGFTATGPTTGSHAKHASVCTTCHNAGTTTTVAPTNEHADGNIDVVGVGYPANKTKGSAGATCSAASCHASVYGSGTAVTPAWGTPSGCSACHTVRIDATGPATGSHVVHANPTCADCHAAGTTATIAPTIANGHTDGNIDVANNGYPPNVAKHAAGTYAGTCTNLNCHGQGTPTWGATSTTPVSGFPYSAAQCGKCHSQEGTVTAGTPFYSTAIPKVTLNTNAKVGAHTAHLASVDSLHPALACADCHGAVTLTGPTHMKGSTTFVFSSLAKTGNLNPAYDPATGKCSSVYCHGGAMPSGVVSGANITPTWNDPNYLPATLTVVGCSTCHGFPPPSSSHASVVIPAGFPNTVSIGTTCSCHDNVDPVGNSYATIFVNSALHINGTLNGGACNSCHGYPPASAGFTGTAGNWEFAKPEEYVGGGGAHTINGHVKKDATFKDGFANCNKCHSAADHATTKPYTPSTNIKVTVNPRLRFEAAKQFKYTSNRVDGAGHVSGNCTNSSCHFGASPKWDPAH
ncbi:MAG: CxxxxCH/CxxCH domain c-type cytochrome [Desulfuromonadaceae bacterium]